VRRTNAGLIAIVTVSIIIPTCKRPQSLARTLASIAALPAHPDALETLVVENGPAGGAQEVVERTRRASPRLNCRYVHEAEPGLLAGRHRGALAARGDVFAFLDDDVRVHAGWLSALTDVFAAPETILASGPSTPSFGAEPPSWLAGFFVESDTGRSCGWLSLFDGGARRKAIPADLVWGLNLAIRRDALFAAGGFNPDLLPAASRRFQGDGESGLTRKLRESGCTAIYEPGLAVMHEIPAARLTAEYFRERAFFLGICDSYTEIRRSGGVAGGPRVCGIQRLRHAAGVAARQSPMTTLRTVASRLAGRADALGRLRRRARRATELERIQQVVADAHLAGYLFHREQVRTDPRLLAWVTRPDYWDYRTPIANPSEPTAVAMAGEHTRD
jgi:GT2 family glycosyltransferase